MTTKEAATLWGVTPSTVRRYCAMGRIKHCEKIKGCWIINPLCHKPFDRRYKKPTIVVSYIIKRFSIGGNGQVTIKNMPPILLPEKVHDGLIVLETQEVLKAA